MMSLINTILAPLLSILGTKFGFIGTVGAYGLAIVPIMTLLIELIQFIVSLTASQADDAVAAKINDAWENYILPVLEIFPHANIPISAGVMAVGSYLGKGLAAIMAAVNAWKNPPAPPAPPAA